MKVTELLNSPLDDKLNKFSAMYEMLIDEWETLASQVPDRKHDYEIAYEEHYMKAEGTIPEKKAEATIKCKDKYLDHLRAEARLAFVKAKISWVDKELSILQTRAANLRSEMQLSALPQPNWR